MISNGSADSGEHQRSPWTQPGFIASAIIVGLVVVLGLVLAVTGGSNTDARPAGPSANAPSPAAEPASRPSERACGLPANDTVPESAPRAKWELVGTMAAPTAPDEVGPGKTVGGFRRCFAHSPLGALYAAVNFWATLSAKPPADTYRQLAAPSRAQRAAIEAADSEDADRLQSRLQVAGYAFSSYDPERAAITLAFRLNDGRLFAVNTTMLWNAKRDDWLYEVPLDQARGSITPIADLGAVVAWSGT